MKCFVYMYKALTKCKKNVLYTKLNRKACSSTEFIFGKKVIYSTIYRYKKRMNRNAYTDIIIVIIENVGSIKREIEIFMPKKRVRMRKFTSLTLMQKLCNKNFRFSKKKKTFKLSHSSQN